MCMVPMEHLFTSFDKIKIGNCNILSGTLEGSGSPKELRILFNGWSSTQRLSLASHALESGLKAGFVLTCYSTESSHLATGVVILSN